jgi:UDP-3-O-[3-hydroxymyristoyl] glucosamine N-acyltransferase
VTLTLQELAVEIGAEVAGGDPDLRVSSVNTLEDAQAGQVSFLSNGRYLRLLETTNASAVIVAPGVANMRVALLRASNPYYAFARAVVKLHGHRRHPHAGIHPAAHVDPAASIGEGTVLYPGVYVGPRARVGRDCILYPNVVVYDDCVLGDRVILHANCSIGHDGFGHATHKGPDGTLVHYKIPQAGNVVIEDDVELGAGCAIDRATLGSTVIGRGTKFSDLVAIGHGSKVGPHGLLVAQVGIAGSVRIGHHVTLAGQVGVAGHLEIGDHVTVGAQSGVINDVPDKSTLLGSPAMPASHARRVYTIFGQLPELLDRIKRLEQQVQELSGDQSSQTGKNDKKRPGPESAGEPPAA